jgi:cysteinyl-tRNA synthetase
MDDDFNISPALAALFRFTHQINKIMDQKGLAPEDKEKVLTAMARIDGVISIMELKEAQVDEETKRLIEKREQARRDKDWATADQLRQKLKEMNIDVTDTKEGSLWRKMPSKNA